LDVVVVVEEEDEPELAAAAVFDPDPEELLPVNEVETVLRMKGVSWAMMRATMSLSLPPELVEDVVC
jgi:hypothetical protein